MESSTFGILLEERLKNDSVNLTSFSIGYRIGDKEAEQIAFVLPTNSTLTELDISYNNIENKGAISLAKALAENKIELTHLDLSFNKIGDEGAEAIISACATNSTLTVLSINCNTIGDKGAIALASLLATNSTLDAAPLSGQKLALKALGLCDNRIGDKGAEAIASSLATNSTLKYLHIYDNDISSRGVEAIALALHTNSTLICLSIDGGYFSDQEIHKCIRGMLNRNKHNKKKRKSTIYQLLFDKLDTFMPRE